MKSHVRLLFLSKTMSFNIVYFPIIITHSKPVFLRFVVLEMQTILQRYSLKNKQPLRQQELNIFGMNVMLFFY